MFKATVELFLSEYFLIKAVLGRYLKDSKDLFFRMSKIFLIPQSEAEKLYILSENELAESILTEKDFLRHQRMLKFTRLNGLADESNPEWEEVVKIKGNAISLAFAHNLMPSAEASRNAVYSAITEAADSGIVSALRIQGILQCEGVYFDKNTAAGIKNLSKAADWNDSVSTLALLKYCPERREFNMARLRMQVQDTPFEKLYADAVETFGLRGGADVAEVKLLKKAFASAVLKREVFDPKYARILYSEILYIKDKENAIFSVNKEQLAVIGNLPLKLSFKRYAAQTMRLSNAPLNREGESETVNRALGNTDLRTVPAYRPLCLCCESRYVLDAYAREIANGSGGAHVELIDVEDVIDYDLEPTPNNIFVRSIDEDKDNAFLLFFSGDIPEKKIDAVKQFLQCAKRAKFHLNNPNVTLNLSAVLPICFCDKANAGILKKFCDVVQLEAVTANEIPHAIDDILSRKKLLYGVDGITLESGAVEFFSRCGIDAVEKLIDIALRAYRGAGAGITLTRDNITPFATELDNEYTIGFGGANYEVKR